MRKTVKKKIFLLVAAMTGISFIHMYWFNSQPLSVINGDQSAYNLIAHNVVNGHGFSMQTALPYEPTIFRTPAYPLFLAAVYSVFGTDNFEAVRLIQINLMLLTGIIVFFLSLQVFRCEIVALLSLLFYSFCGFDYYTGYGVYGYLFSEPLTVFFVTAAVYQLVMAQRNGTQWHICAAGGFAALAALTRPASLALCLIAIVLVFPIRDWKRNIYKSLLFCGVCLFLITPWTVRNYICFRKLILLSAPLNGLMVLQGAIIKNPDFIPYADEDFTKNGVAFDNAELRDIRAGLADFFSHTTSIEVLKYDKRLLYIGFRIIRREPLAFCSKWFYRTLGHWHFSDIANIINGINRRITFTKAVLILIKMSILAVVIAAVFANYHNRRFVTLILFPITNTLLYTIFTPQIRYAIPSYPFIIIAFSAGFWALTQRMIERIGIGWTFLKRVRILDKSA